MSAGLEFDPGFAPYILAFKGSIEYIYLDINKFKNLSQKKMKFRQYYKKIIELFNNNLGFFTGCLLWAGYIKTQDEQKILNNHCLGLEYNEEENTAEVDFMLKFFDLFSKDMKYFLGENFEFSQNYKKIIEMYKEFLIINKGFVKSEKNTDIKLPSNMKTENASKFNSIVSKAIKAENLSLLIDSADMLL